MMTHHIGGTAREMILQKLVVQMQQRVFDVILQWYVDKPLRRKQGKAKIVPAIVQP